MTMKYLIIIIIAIVAGYLIYDHYLAPTPQVLERSLNGKWFSVARNPMPQFKEMVERFEVAPDFAVTVYLSPEYRTIDDSPKLFFKNVRNFISVESPKPAAQVKFVFQGEDVTLE
jgi:hypothetical protein